MPDPFGNPDLLQIFSQGMAFLQQSIQHATQVQLERQQLHLRARELDETLRWRTAREDAREQLADIREEEIRARTALAEARIGEIERRPTIPTAQETAYAKTILGDIKATAARIPLPETLITPGRDPTGRITRSLVSGIDVYANSDQLATRISKTRDNLVDLQAALPVNTAAVSELDAQLRGLEEAYKFRKQSEDELINQLPPEQKATLDLVAPVAPPVEIPIRQSVTGMGPEGFMDVTTPAPQRQAPPIGADLRAQLRTSINTYSTQPSPVTREKLKKDAILYGMKITSPVDAEQIYGEIAVRDRALADEIYEEWRRARAR